jgi:propionyl-CoA carboxylase alpha chain
VVGDQHSTVSVDLTESGYLVSLDNSDYQVETNWSLGEPLFKATVNDKDISVQVESGAKGYKLFYQGAEINAQVLSPKATMLSAHMIFKAPADTSKFLLSPMPGLLVKMAVQEGQEIKEGEELAVVEAMKMENSLRAVQDGIVAKISAIEGDSLMVDEIILEFE